MIPSEYSHPGLSRATRESPATADMDASDDEYKPASCLRDLDRLHLLLRAFARGLEQCPEMVYLIAGDGPLRAHLEAVARELGIEEKVRFLGHFASHDRLRHIYHLSDVFLFPTLYEGQPRTVVEALLSQLPIICANYGQVCEVVVDGEDGLWVDPLDIDAVANAIVRLGTNHDIRLRMAQHTNFDAHRFSEERVSAQEAEFYLSAISSEYVNVEQVGISSE